MRIGVFNAACLDRFSNGGANRRCGPNWQTTDSVSVRAVRIKLFSAPISFSPRAGAFSTRLATFFPAVDANRSGNPAPKTDSLSFGVKRIESQYSEGLLACEAAILCGSLRSLLRWRRESAANAARKKNFFRLDSSEPNRIVQFAEPFCAAEEFLLRFCGHFLTAIVTRIISAAGQERG